MNSRNHSRTSRVASRQLLCVAALVLAAPLALADGHGHKNTPTAFICSKDGVARKVSVEYEGAAKVPCRVKYEKPGQLEYPWRAERQSGYCESKAEHLVERLRGFGWNCEAVEET